MKSAQIGAKILVSVPFFKRTWKKVSLFENIKIKKLQMI